MPAISRSSVLFPDPLAPITPRLSPRRTSRLTPRRAQNGSAFCDPKRSGCSSMLLTLRGRLLSRKDLATSRTAMAGSDTR
jgi:hypothetical protein